MGPHQPGDHLPTKGNPKWETSTTLRAGRKICRQRHPQGIHLQTYKQLVQPNIKNKYNPRKKWAKDWNGYFSKEGLQIAVRCMERCSASLIILSLSLVAKSCPTLATTWTVACQASLSMGFSRQEYWGGLPFPSPGDLPHPGIEPRSPALQVDSLPAEPPGKPKNTGVGSLSLLQGIFPTQGSNPGLPHWGWILYQLSHKGSPRILEWVAYPFSRGSSWPRNRTRVSCIAAGFFTNWAIIRETQIKSPMS